VFFWHGTTSVPALWLIVVCGTLLTAVEALKFDALPSLLSTHGFQRHPVSECHGSR
jgi:hypothetical protein